MMTSEATPTATTPANKTQQAITILQRSVCLVMTCGYVGNYRKVDPNGLDIAKDGESLEKEKKSLTVTKRLVDAEFLRPCEAIISQAKSFVRGRSIAAHRVFGPGTALVPVERVSEVEDGLTTLEADLQVAKKALAARWDEVREKSKERHGKLFVESQFPTAEDVLNDYSIEWSYVSFAAPDRLEDIDSAVHKSAQEKYQAKLASAYEEVVVQLRTTALTIMKDLANRLRPGKENKVKALMPTALRDLQNLMEQLPVLNLTDDDMLADIVTKVGALSQGIDVDTLRKNSTIRTMLLDAAEEAVAELDSIITTGVRTMDLS
jgi:hypothetical protein